MYQIICRPNLLITGLFLLTLCMAPHPVLAEQPAPADKVPDAIGLISELLEEQDKQINLLHQQIENLQNTLAKPPKANAQRVTEAQDFRTKAQLVADFSMQKERNRVISMVVICFIAVVSLITSLHYTAKLCLHSGNEKMRRNDMMNIIALHLIVFGTLLLVLASLSSEQLTAAVGVLGALAGYVFRGLNENRDTDADQTTSKPDVSAQPPA